MSQMIGAWLGRAGDRAHIRKGKSEKEFATFSLAIHRRENGEDVSDWSDVVVFADFPVRVARTIEKGDLVFVIGQLQYRTQRNDEGKVTEKRASVKATHLEVYEGAKQRRVDGPTSRAPEEVRRETQRPDEEDAESYDSAPW